MKIDLFRKMGFFGGCWFSFMIFVGAIFFGSQWAITATNPDYVFSSFWRWDIIGIMLLVTCAVSIFVTKKTTALKETFKSIWNFGPAWVFLMFIFNFMLFTWKQITLHMNPDYSFTKFWQWDIVGIAAIATCIVSIYLIWFKGRHAKK